METLSIGQKVKNLLGKSGYIFNTTPNPGEVEVLYPGETKPVIVKTSTLNQPERRIPTAVDVVMEDNQGSGGNIFSVMGRVTEMARQLQVPRSEIEKYSSDIVSGKVGDYKKCLLYSVQFLKKNGL